MLWETPGEMHADFGKFVSLIEISMLQVVLIIKTPGICRHNDSVKMAKNIEDKEYFFIIR